VVNNPFLFVLHSKYSIFFKKKRGSDANGNMGSFDPFSILRKLAEVYSALNKQAESRWMDDGPTQKLCPIRLADKAWLKVLLSDLL